MSVTRTPGDSSFTLVWGSELHIESVDDCDRWNTTDIIRLEKKNPTIVSSTTVGLLSETENDPTDTEP